MSKRIRAFAPATVANVCCGFDILGFALDAPGDEVEVTFTDRPGVTILKITGDNGNLPTDPKVNTAGVSVQAMLDHVQFDGGIDIILVICIEIDQIQLMKHMVSGTRFSTCANSTFTRSYLVFCMSEKVF